MNQTEANPSNNADAGRGLSEGLGPKVHTKDWVRCAEALRQRREGKTFAAIAAEMGVSRERVRQMTIQGERREEALKNAEASPLDVLSVRAKNCLLAEKYSSSTGRDEPTPQEVRAWLDSGRLKKIPNMGKKSVQEVAAWLAAIGA
jgi:hypothetical protein